MWIKEINLKNYRNYNSIETNFSPKLNIFVGQNAQGKTNFLEAIYFLSLTRSHRTRSDKELIKFGEKELMVSGVINRVNGKIPLEINLSDKGRTTKVNHLKQSKLSDYIGTMTVVLFAPEDLQLVKGAPSLRRKFIDIDLGQIKSIYLSDLSNYNHTLKQRNTYLKTHKKIDFNFLSVLDEQLVNYGSRVIEHRLNFINDLSTEAKKHHLKISNQTETLRVSYLPSIKYDDQKNIQENFLSQLQKTISVIFLKKVQELVLIVMI